MNDKLITHADLDALRRIKEAVGNADTDALLDRLIAAAEADTPPLPEGWVLYTNPDTGESRVLWHAKGRLSSWTDGGDDWGNVSKWDGRLSPLRPTVTEADVEKAAQRAWRIAEKVGIDRAREIVRTAFAAAGIEVSDR